VNTTERNTRRWQKLMDDYVYKLEATSKCREEPSKGEPLAERAGSSEKIL